MVQPAVPFYICGCEEHVRRTRRFHIAAIKLEPGPVNACSVGYRENDKVSTQCIMCKGQRDTTCHPTAKNFSKPS